MICIFNNHAQLILLVLLMVNILHIIVILILNPVIISLIVNSIKTGSICT